jgi:hypothetical protein
MDAGCEGLSSPTSPASPRPGLSSMSPGALRTAPTATASSMWRVRRHACRPAHAFRLWAAALFPSLQRTCARRVYSCAADLRTPHGTACMCLACAARLQSGVPHPHNQLTCDTFAYGPASANRGDVQDDYAAAGPCRLSGGQVSSLSSKPGLGATCACACSERGALRRSYVLACQCM